MHIKKFVICVVSFVISAKLLDVMILNKSLLLYINHFDSINKIVSNSAFI